MQRMNIRQLHLNLGTFFAPAILFFSLTGALQTFGWHENKGGAQNPVWISKLAEVHKEQHFKGEERARPAQSASGAQAASGANTNKPPSRGEERERRERSPLPLKIFVFLMSLGLILTTILGITMAFKFSRDRRVVWALLVSGTVLPVALLFT